MPKINYNAGLIPARLPYPAQEESLNNTNLKAALGNIGGENTMKVKLWWAK